MCKDPVVTLFAKWGAIQDEATVLSAANPEAETGELNDRWEAALDRRDAVGDKIMETPATSPQGAVVKLRIYVGIKNFSESFDSPDWPDQFAVQALADLERLAGGAS